MSRVPPSAFLLWHQAPHCGSCSPWQWSRSSLQEQVSKVGLKGSQSVADRPFGWFGGLLWLGRGCYYPAFQFLTLPMRWNFLKGGEVTWTPEGHTPLQGMDLSLFLGALLYYMRAYGTLSHGTLGLVSLRIEKEWQDRQGICAQSWRDTRERRPESRLHMQETLAPFPHYLGPINAH